jgi:hypothetical protein
VIASDLAARATNIVFVQRSALRFPARSISPLPLPIQIKRHLFEIRFRVGPHRAVKDRTAERAGCPEQVRAPQADSKRDLTFERVSRDRAQL